MLNLAKLAWLPALKDLSDLFAAHGHELVVFGGAIRDHLLDRTPADVDVLSDARPEESSKLLEIWTGNVGDTTGPFGVVECVHDGLLVQVVPYRTLECNTWPRPLSEIIGNNVEDHLACLDVTINTTSLRLANLEIVDPFNGAADIENRLLRTPISPWVAVGNNSLLALRVARFVAQFSFSVDGELVAALRDTAGGVVNGEPRFRDQLLGSILAVEHPQKAVQFLAEVGIVEHLPSQWRRTLDEVRKLPPASVRRSRQ